MIIGVTGYGATGASAYIDLIKEFESVQSYESSMEFQLLQETDGILDLKYNIVDMHRRVNINSVLVRYKNNIHNQRNRKMQIFTRGQYENLAVNYFNSLTDVTWKGTSSYDPQDVRPYYDKGALRYFNAGIRRILRAVKSKKIWPPKKDRNYSSLDEQEFNCVTAQFLQEVFKASGFDLEKPILVEQIFNTSNPLIGMEFFDDARAIIVDRDPRDVYALANYYYPQICSFMPNDRDVEKFIKYYRSIHSKRINDPRVKYVRYEDLVYRYDDTTEEISTWLGLEHVNKGTFFKPEYSINNTQVYLKYNIPEAVKKIEEGLPDMLFDFDKASRDIRFSRMNIGIFDRQSDAEKAYRKMNVD